MKYYLLGLSILLITGCKDNKQPEQQSDNVIFDSISLKEMVMNDSITSIDSLVVDDWEKGNQSLKREVLRDLPDDRLKLQNLLISKSFYKEEDQYVLDFKYPLLNVQLDPEYNVFNDYINDHYLDIQGAEAQILEDKDWLCDTLNANNYRERRRVDYKVYQSMDDLLSLVFYRENYYSGAMHSSYYFDCINFDLKHHEFMGYDEVFTKNSEEILFATINQILLESIETGDEYYDCWELSLGDFNEYKDNFVIGNKFVEFYFDDCVICPAYTGTFSVEIPKERIRDILKKGQNESDQ
jgi:hypothetical protein